MGGNPAISPGGGQEYGEGHVLELSVSWALPVGKYYICDLWALPPEFLAGGPDPFRRGAWSGKQQTSSPQVTGYPFSCPSVSLPAPRAGLGSLCSQPVGQPDSCHALHLVENSGHILPLAPWYPACQTCEAPFRHCFLLSPLYKVLQRRCKK